MSEGLTFYFAVDPTPKGRPRTTRSGHTYTPKETRLAEQAIVSLARSRYSGAPLMGALEVHMSFHYKRPKRPSQEYPSRHDLDNLVKLVADALNEIVWKDDRQICKLVCEKHYSEVPGISVKVLAM